MDRAHDGAARITAPSPSFVSGAIDGRSAAVALGGGWAFFVFGTLCLSLSRFDAVLASVWLPNAMAVALLLLARPRCEAAAYAGFATGSFAAQALSGFSAGAAALLTAANLIDIALVTWLTRRACGGSPDMSDLAHLGRFLFYGGFVGPAVSAVIAAFAMVGPIPEIVTGVTSWFLADSMGMILIVPAALLIMEARRSREVHENGEALERGVLMLGGMIAVVMVFSQSESSLMFVVPPITLLVAFRLGGLGTALYVPGAAIAASWMTYSGHGPIAGSAGSDIGKMFVMQAFIAANFLTGLPIAAILAGRDRMTGELTRGRRELALLAENVTDAVLRIDNQGVCTYASPSVRSVLARDPQSLIGHPFASGSRDDETIRLGEVIEGLLRGQADKDRVSFRRPDDGENGQAVYVEADCAVAFDPETGTRSGVVISARDVTARVELEQLLTRARQTAEEAAQAKSQFLANMSHEIRTPMNGVLGFAELMLQGDLGDEDRHHVRMIAQSGRSMMTLLNDILDLSKIEAGQITIDNAPVDLFTTISDCAAMHRPAAAEKGLVLSVSLAPDDPHEEAPPQWIVTDALRLRQILLNLIGNAVKFTESGRVDIRCSRIDDSVVVEIADTGIGIGEDRLAAIFAPFTQGESDISRRFGGTGLGLTISRQLAELLGGRIEVDSRRGAGSTFRLILPAVTAPPQAKEATPGKTGSDPVFTTQTRVLLVEDHDVNRALAVEMLERCGQTVAVAHDGHEAIAMVIDGMMRETPYDLVLMDVQMPGCDGYTAARAIRAEGIGASALPIIALTANAFPEDIAAAKAAGMQGHLAKPLGFAELAAMLQRWLPTRIVETSPSQTDSSAAKPHSPGLLRQWQTRRLEAIRAVRQALATGALERDCPVTDSGEELARLVHKLAGTAAIFGEAELGDQAAALERAIRQNMSAHLREALARDLLDLAEANPASMTLTGG